MTVFIVAELSGNHNQSLSRAKELVHAAKEAGADAVKVQTFEPEKLAIGNTKYATVPSGPWAGRTLVDLYRDTQLPWSWHEELFALAKSLDLVAFSSPFHVEAVDFLETLGCPIYKVASPEIGDIPLLQRIARTGKPVIASNGMSKPGELGALEGLLNYSDRLTWLHCVSEYPADPAAFALADFFNSFRVAYDSPPPPALGLSDHSLTPTAAVCAVALGAAVIEKHLCLRRSDGGPDSEFSLEPHEFKQTVEIIREAEKCLAPGSKGASPSSYAWLRKSLWIVKDAKAGEMITAEHVRSLRPSNGLPPSEYAAVIGRRFQLDAKAGEPLRADDLAP